MCIENKLGKLRRNQTGSGKLSFLFTNQLTQQPLQSLGLRRSRAHVNQRRQNLRQKPSAGRIQPYKAADLQALLAVSQSRDLADVRGKHRARFHWNGRQIAGQNKGPLARE